MMRAVHVTDVVASWRVRMPTRDVLHACVLQCEQCATYLCLWLCCRQRGDVFIDIVTVCC